MGENDNDWQRWLGNSETCNDTITVMRANAMAALLDRQDIEVGEGLELPPLWHWLYFLAPTPQSNLAADGHAKRGGFLPPISLPGRMWAGSKLSFHHPLRVGERVCRHSTISNIESKQGRSGQLVFVQVDHIYTANGRNCLDETQTIVYREAAGGKTVGDAAQESPGSDFSRTITPDVTLLFRYSALTLNAHRIHYDRGYARETEGYPGLVVHGPLVATLLVDLLDRHLSGSRMKEFEFRAVSPLFDDGDFQLHGKQPDAEGRAFLWAENNAGAAALRAIAKLV